MYKKMRGESKVRSRLTANKADTATGDCRALLIIMGWYE